MVVKFLCGRSHLTNNKPFYFGANPEHDLGIFNIIFTTAGKTVFVKNFAESAALADSSFTHSFIHFTPPRAGSGVVRMDPLRFLAGCRTRRLNQA